MSGLDIHFELPKFPRMKILYARNWFKVAKYDEQYTLFCRSIQTHGLVVKNSSSELGYMGLISAGCWNSLLPLGYFEWHWARHCTDTCFYIVLSLLFLSRISSIAIWHWQPATGFKLLTWTSDFTVYEYLDSGLGPGLAQMCWPGAWTAMIAII